LICTKFGNNDIKTYAYSVTLNSVQVCTCQDKMFRGIIFVGHSDIAYTTLAFYWHHDTCCN